MTNFDIHDIARAATVYGVEKYYIIHPMQEQRMFVDRVLDHWRTGQGAKFNPKRKTALNPCARRPSIAERLRWNVPMSTIALGLSRGLQKIHLRLRNDMHVAQKRFYVIGRLRYAEDALKSCPGVLEIIKGARLLLPPSFRKIGSNICLNVYMDPVLPFTLWKIYCYTY